MRGFSIRFGRAMIKALILLLVFAFIGLSAGLLARADTIGSGSQGDDVAEIQKRLKAWGYYDGVIDGRYGQGMVEAVKRFQKKCGFTQTGQIDDATSQKLGVSMDSIMSNASVRPGQRSDADDSGGGDVLLLAQCIYACAREEPYNAKAAIGATILNRVKSASFPSTLSGVIYQPEALPVDVDGIANLSPDDASIKAARDAMNGFDPGNGALFFYNPQKTADEFLLSRDVLATIGGYKFCA